MIQETFKDKLVNFSFVFPAFLIFSIFYIYPFFYIFILSFQEYDLISSPVFVGLQNFREVLFSGTPWWDSMWWNSVRNGVFITFCALTFQNFLAFALALAVDRVVRLNRFYRVVFFLLPVLSEVIIGLLMKQLLAGEPIGRGVLNQIFNNIGLSGFTHNWLGTNSVLFVTALVHCWKGFGWAFIIFLAGLQSIPEQLYEAARIDGASAYQSFSKITIPLLMPVLTLIIVLTMLGTMQTFAMIFALTGGAGGLTEVPVMLIFNHIKSNQAGLACAEGVVLGIMLVFVSFLMFFVSKKIREKYGVLSN
ncbi:MAG: sugar ABC transporter permease [Candidatus Omnitrophica bacterium]|nr:sugar ABC transporter permease [Candidatus Omnitrophota bacterium]